jgi:phospholipase/lecithinase/hemolysin
MCSIGNLNCSHLQSMASMKKSVLAIALFLAALLLTLMTSVVLSTKQPAPIQQLVVFGDSLSDTGVVYRATNGLYPPNPPYYQGRYSNGRVWVEYLAEALAIKQVNNFACGGATTVNGRENLVPGLLAQVQSFVQTTPQLSSSALYVLWAGANDYLQGANTVAQPVDNIQQAIATLASKGARRFLVANLPDLGQIPATHNQASAARLSTLTQQHNQSLRRSLKVLNQQSPDLQIVTLDSYALYQTAIANPSEFGFSQVKSACLAGARACGQPDQFLFWDDIHPTTRGHQILADSALKSLEAQAQLSLTHADKPFSKTSEG